MQRAARRATYIQTACRNVLSEHGMDAIGCQGTSPRDGWAAMGQGGGRGRSHPPRNTARLGLSLLPCAAGNEDSWTMQVAAVVTMHEVDGTDTAGAERARLGLVPGWLWIRPITPPSPLCIAAMSKERSNVLPRMLPPSAPRPAC